MISTHEHSMLSINSSSGRCTIGSSVESRLLASGYLALRRIECECAGGVLYLRGCVPTHYLKQVAQAIAAQVEGVRQVENQLRVHAGPVGGASRGPDAESGSGSSTA